MAKKDKPAPQNRGMNAYEKDRMKIIESNAAIMKAKGIKNIVNKVLQEKYEKISRGQLDANLMEEDDVDCQFEVQVVAKKRNCSRVMKEKPQITPTLMAEFLQWKQEEKRKLAGQDQNQQCHRNLNVQKNHSNFCAPGSLAKNASMKKIQVLKGQQSNSLHLSEAHPTNCDESDSSEDVPGTNTRYKNMRKAQDLRGYQSNDMNDTDQRSEDLLLDDGADFSKDDDINQNEVSSVPGLITENAAVTIEKKRRGKTILANVYTRTMEERDVIILNSVGQPVGPTTKIVSTFSQFLGTLARDSNYAPLNFTSWRKVPTKDKIWAFLQKKYIVPEEGKGWVMASVNAKWRAYKSKLKRMYYSPNKTIEDMLAKRPTNIPKEEFRDLLKYFDSEYAKELSEKNKGNRAKQCDMHTLGPRSYAVQRHVMQQNDPKKQCPLEADVYMESRKRVVGRTYSTQNEETLENIEKMKSLKSMDEGSSKTDPYFTVITKKEHNGRLRIHGLGVTKSSCKRKDVKTPFVLPQVFLEGITEHFNKKMEETMNSVLSKIREANPGVDIVIPDFPTNQEDVSTSDGNAVLSDQD